MALLQTITPEHLPSNYTLQIAVYRDVKNASFLHQQLLACNSDFEYAFIDATVILSRVHALSAAYRAVNDLIENRLKSRNVHSEIVFSLSPKNNIAESFRRFGITPTSINLLVIKVSTPSKPYSSNLVQEHLTESVDGTQVGFVDETLAEMTDLARVRKYYKLNNIGGKVGGTGVPSKEEKRELEMLILGSMALRGATN